MMPRRCRGSERPGPPGPRRPRPNENEWFIEDQPFALELSYGSETALRANDLIWHLTEAKKKKRSIHALNFLGSTFSDSPTSVFNTLSKKRFRRISSLEELTISNISPHLSGEDLASLSPFLRSNTSTLKSLEISGVASTTFEPIKKFFRRSDSLEKLILSGNAGLGDEGVTLILAQMNRMTKKGRRLRKRNLSILSVESCGLGLLGATSVASFMLLQGGSLRHLDLSDNPGIGDAGVEVISAALKGHKLENLALNNCGITDWGARQLSSALKTNRCSLHTLRLRSNEIEGQGADALIASVFDCTSIRSVALSNHKLRELDLRGCPFISSRHVELADQLAALSQEVDSGDELCRSKIRMYLNSVPRPGVVLEEFALELLPSILAQVGKMDEISCLFQTLRSLPELYSHYDPYCNQTNDLKAPKSTFLEDLRRSSRKRRKKYIHFHSSASITVPVKTLHQQTCRASVKREVLDVPILTTKILSISDTVHNSKSFPKKLDLTIHSNSH